MANLCRLHDHHYRQSKPKECFATSPSLRACFAFHRRSNLCPIAFLRRLTKVSASFRVPNIWNQGAVRTHGRLKVTWDSGRLPHGSCTALRILCWKVVRNGEQLVSILRWQHIQDETVIIVHTCQGTYRNRGSAGSCSSRMFRIASPYREVEYSVVFNGLSFCHRSGDT